MSAVGITENVKGDSKKFEVWYNGREEVYIIQVCGEGLTNVCFEVWLYSTCVTEVIGFESNLPDNCSWYTVNLPAFENSNP